MLMPKHKIHQIYNIILKPNAEVVDYLKTNKQISKQKQTNKKTSAKA